MERYRSGHNGADSKSVCANAHEGSNPSLSAIKQGHPQQRMLFVLRRIKKGFERSEQNNPVSCFVNGDRSFLRDITKKESEISSKKQERIPLSPP